MNWLKRGGFAFGVLIVALAVIPFFVSLNDYIAQIEKGGGAAQGASEDRG
jgi:hypothetical protein